MVDLMGHPDDAHWI